MWAQESFQQMCRFFCMPPKGSAPDPPDGLTSLSEWRTNLHSPWRHVRAHRKTSSSLCFKTEETSSGQKLGSTKLWHEKIKKCFLNYLKTVANCWSSSSAPSSRAIDKAPRSVQCSGSQGYRPVRMLLLASSYSSLSTASSSICYTIMTFDEALRFNTPVCSFFMIYLSNMIYKLERSMWATSTCCSLDLG